MARRTIKIGVMRRGVIQLLALLALSLALVPGAAAAEPEAAEPSFCEGHVLHDYLAPLKRMPELREPPYRATGRVFRLRGVRIAASGPSLAISGGSAGYQLNWDANPRWDVTVILSRVDWRGRVVQRIGQRRLRLGKLAPAITTEPGFVLSGEPAAYRTTLTIRSPSGRKLAEYGNYYRVVKPTIRARLALSAPAYSPGATLFARVENPGAAFALFGQEYAIEKLEGETWVRAPESPGAFKMPLYFIEPGRTSGHCTVFPIPTSMPAGRYRLAQEFLFAWPGMSSGGPRHTRKIPRRPLYAEFDVVVP